MASSTNTTSGADQLRALHALLDGERGPSADELNGAIERLPDELRGRALVCLARLLLSLPPWKNTPETDGILRQPFIDMLDRLDRWLDRGEDSSSLRHWLDEDWAIQSAEATQDWIDEVEVGTTRPYDDPDEALRTVSSVQGLGWELLEGKRTRLSISQRHLDYLGLPAARTAFGRIERHSAGS